MRFITEFVFMTVSSIFKARTKYKMVLLFTTFYMIKIFRKSLYFTYVPTSKIDNTFTL